MIHVSIPSEFEPFVEGIVASGSYHNPTEVVGEALRLLARREQVLRDVKAGVAQLDRGEYTEYGQGSLDEFLADVKAEEKNRFPGAESQK
jgi:putative addiction module CopG family antidote